MRNVITAKAAVMIFIRSMVIGTRDMSVIRKRTGEGRSGVNFVKSGTKKPGNASTDIFSRLAGHNRTRTSTMDVRGTSGRETALRIGSANITTGVNAAAIAATAFQTTVSARTLAVDTGSACTGFLSS